MNQKINPAAPISPTQNSESLPTRTVKRSAKFQLAMLVTMLILVAYAMREAGKPESWTWMGFEQSGGETDGLTIEQKADLRGQPEQTNSLSGDNPVATSNQFHETTAIKEYRLLGDTEFPYPDLAERFWIEELPRLNPDQQRTLYRILKQLRSGQQYSQEKTDPFSPLVERLFRLRNVFHEKWTEKLAWSVDADEKHKIANDLFESNRVWEEMIYPALKSVGNDADEITVSQLQHLQKLQQILDPLLLAEIKDHTPIGWSGDSTMWVRLWEQVTTDKIQKPERASYLQLSGQPASYRGQPVEIEGWLRRGRKEILSKSELGVDHYYQLWLRPVDSNVGPFCVYSTQPPSGFRDLNGQYIKLNQRVKIKGLFFKLRTYQDTEQIVRSCPVILTNNITSVEQSIPTSVTNWQPSRSALIVIFSMLPVIAGLIAWSVFRNSRKRQHTPGGQTAMQIEKTLQALSDDPVVQTDAEKIKDLYDAREN